MVELIIEKIEVVLFLKWNFLGEEWGGGNEFYLLEDERIGVFGYIVCFDEVGNCYYYVCFFWLNEDFL